MVDYSKWNNIEISDDEDDAHPNFDTPSLSRWRHQARLKRMEEHKKEVENFEKKKNDHDTKMSEAKKKLFEAQSNLAKLQEAFKELEKEGDNLKQMEEELKKKEEKTSWNVDTISKPGFSKTLISTIPSRPKGKTLIQEEYQEEWKHYGMLQRYDDSRAYLKAHDYLICEDTFRYLADWCIILKMEQKHDLAEHVMRQTDCMGHILQLAKELHCDARASSDLFFAYIQVGESEHQACFEKDLHRLKDTVRRNVEKMEETFKEVERQRRLGPGGLDPVEVLECLPDELRKCFESRDITLLHETVAKMNMYDVLCHMNLCIDSGLWIP